MSLAQKLERLVRLVPGMAGYRDRETARDTDKAIRLRLAGELEELKRHLEEDQRQLTENKDLSLLPALDRLVSKLDKLGNLIKYAGRGYRGFFDITQIDQKKLDQLCSFDLGLFDELESIKAHVKEVAASQREAAPLKDAIGHLDQALNRFEKLLSARQDSLTAP